MMRHQRQCCRTVLRPLLNAGLVSLCAQGDEANRSSDVARIVGATVPSHHGNWPQTYGAHNTNSGWA